MNQRLGGLDEIRRKSVGLGTQQSTSEFAERILDRARSLGLNKVQLAVKAGVSRQTLDNLLAFANGTGAAMPAIRTFLLLGEALRVHPAWLIEGLFKDVVVDMPIATRMHFNRSPEVRDLNYPDGLVAAPGSTFTKQWLVTNTGVNQWPELHVVCLDKQVALRLRRNEELLFAAANLQAVNQTMTVPPLAPGECTVLAMEFQAPPTNGTVISRWMTQSASGSQESSVRFGLWAMVHVTTLADTLAFEPLPD